MYALDKAACLSARDASDGRSSCSSYRVRSIERRGCLAATRSSSCAIRDEKLGSGRGGRISADDEGSEEESSAAISDSAAARCAGVGSGSMSIRLLVAIASRGWRVS